MKLQQHQFFKNNWNLQAVTGQGEESSDELVMFGSTFSWKPESSRPSKNWTRRVSPQHSISSRRGWRGARCKRSWKPSEIYARWRTWSSKRTHLRSQKSSMATTSRGSRTSSSRRKWPTDANANQRPIQLSRQKSPSLCTIFVYSNALMGYTSTLIYPAFLEELVELF
jgi:hypothetical protein